MRPFESPDLQGPGFLFPYAEVGEDVAEDVVGMDGAYYCLAVHHIYKVLIFNRLKYFGL
jgi:hypothetical protein